MESPTGRDPESLRDAKSRVLRAIEPLAPENVVRAQFRGYRSEPDVSSDSHVETFAAVRLSIDSWRWAGVPFYIRAGKCLPVTCAEVLVDLKAPPRSVFGEPMSELVGTNYMRFRLGPDVAIALGVRSKIPGESMAGRNVELLAASDVTGQMLPYERLLGDAMKGDATLFAREDAVEAAWSIVAPVLGNAPPLHEYEPGSWGPAQADRLISRSGGWHRPHTV